VEKSAIEEAEAIFADMIKGYNGCKEKDCPFKGLTMFMLRIKRFLEQYKCIEKFKYEESERRKENIEWEGALKLWADKGYAAKFHNIYRKDMHFEEIYTQVMRSDNQSKSIADKVDSPNQISL